MKKTDCDICFKIICKQCQWEPDEGELVKMAEGTLTVCPVCGWSPAS